MILTTSKNAANVSWYALIIQTVSDASKCNCDEIVGMAGNRAELLNASRNCARVNVVIRAILRAVEAFARLGFCFSGSRGVSPCSSNVSVSIVFVAVNSAPSLLSFFDFPSPLRVKLGNREVGSQRVSRRRSLQEGESTLDALEDDEFLWVS